MKLFEISNRGLAVIGILVLVLWGLILAERAVIEQAREEHYEFLQSHPAAFQPEPTSHPGGEPAAAPPESISQIGIPSSNHV